MLYNKYFLSNKIKFLPLGVLYDVYLAQSRKYTFQRQKDEVYKYISEVAK